MDNNINMGGAQDEAIINELDKEIDDLNIMDKLIGKKRYLCEFKSV